MHDPQGFGRTVRFVIASLLGALFLLAPGGTATAATYSVTSSNAADDGVCDGAHCSIVEALDAANAALGADTIDLSAVSGATIDVTGAGMTTAAALAVTAEAHIMGANVTLTATTGAIMFISAPATIENITFTGGTGNAGTHITAEAAVAAHGVSFTDGVTGTGGGVIKTDSPLSLTDVELYDNTNASGGMSLINSTSTIVIRGADIRRNASTIFFSGIRGTDVTIDNATFVLNQFEYPAVYSSGAFSGDNITFTDNTGGFLQQAGSGFVISDSTFTNTTVPKVNFIQAGGGSAAALDNVSIQSTDFADNFGMVLHLSAATATITDSSIDGTTHTGSSGATSVMLFDGDTITMDNAAFTGNGSLPTEYIVFLASDNATITNSRFSGNTAGDATNGVSGIMMDNNGVGAAGSITVDNTTFENGVGRALAVHIPFTVTGSTFDNNTANDTRKGGALSATAPVGADPHIVNAITKSSFTGNASANQGGAVYVYSSDNTTLLVSDSTFSGNAVTGDGGIVSLEGGHLDARNLTISGNTAAVDNPEHFGAGLHTRYGSVSLDSLTITDNAVTTSVSTTSGAGGLVTWYGSGTRTITNSVVYANSEDGSPDDCSLTGLSSGGFNILGTGCEGIAASGDMTGTDPLLEPLADNGGPGFTHDLALASPAIDAGNTALVTDARGLARPAGGGDDIGAVEWQPVVPSPAVLAFAAQKVGTTSASMDATLTFAVDAVSATVTSSSTEFSVTDDCTGSFTMGDTCTVTVTFTPGGLGARSGSLEVSATDASADTFTASVNLSGEGTSGEFSISPFSIDFGALTMGDTATAGITVTSTPTAPLSVSILSMDISGDADVFSSTDDCPVVLAPGESCVITVTFAPLAAGDYAATATVTTDDFDTPTMQASLSGTGVTAADNDTGGTTGEGTASGSSSSGGGGGCSAGAGGGFGLLLLIGLVIVRLRRAA